jgi:hypothetical protein
MQENFQWPPFYSKFFSHDLHAWPGYGLGHLVMVGPTQASQDKQS